MNVSIIVIAKVEKFVRIFLVIHQLVKITSKSKFAYPKVIVFTRTLNVLINQMKIMVVLAFLMINVYSTSNVSLTSLTIRAKTMKIFAKVIKIVIKELAKIIKYANVLQITLD